MSHPYLVRIPIVLGTTLSDAEEHQLEQQLQRLLASTESPFAADTVIDCVEVFQACPCCDGPATTCDCQWCAIHERECTTHGTRVPEGAK